MQMRCRPPAAPPMQMRQQATSPEPCTDGNGAEASADEANKALLRQWAGEGHGSSEEQSSSNEGNFESDPSSDASIKLQERGQKRRASDDRDTATTKRHRSDSTRGRGKRCEEISSRSSSHAQSKTQDDCSKAPSRFTVDKLHEAGFTPDELEEAGFSATAVSQERQLELTADDQGVQVPPGPSADAPAPAESKPAAEATEPELVLAGDEVGWLLEVELEEGFPRIAPVVEHAALIQPLLREATHILYDLGVDAGTDVELVHDPDWSKHPQIGEGLISLGYEEAALCVAVCRSKSIWAVGLAGNKKKRIQAARLSLCIALAANADSLHQVRQRKDGFLQLCAIIGMSLEDAGAPPAAAAPIAEAEASVTRIHPEPVATPPGVSVMVDIEPDHSADEASHAPETSGRAVSPG
jgi:hypothetical protein